MKAVLCRDWGDTRTLVVEEIDQLSPVPSETRISVHASSVNFADELIVAGKYEFTPPFPFSPSFEVSGVIAETGREATDLSVGDRVMAALAVRGRHRQASVYHQPGLKEPGRSQRGADCSHSYH